MAVNVDQSAQLASFLGIEDFRPGFPYKTYDLIGVGSTGLGVFKACDISSKKKYAVKIFNIRRDYAEYALRETTPAADGTVQGYVREFRQILKLKHDNIVKYFFADVRSMTLTDGQQYHLCIFMERCGETLLHDMDDVYRQNHTGYKASEVHQYFVGLASGLHYLHELHRIAHRHLRPENLIFAETDKKILKIADCTDSSFLQDSVTMPGEVTTIGGLPPHYKAPETVINSFGHSGRRSDVWSLACILIFMLQGKAPESPYTSNQRRLVAVAASEVQEALAQGARTYFEGDFNRKTTYGDEGFFLNLAKNLLRQCFVAYSTERPDMNAICSHPFVTTSDFSRDNVLLTMQGDTKVLDTAVNSTAALLEQGPLPTAVFNGETFGCSACQYSYSYNDHIGKGAFGIVFRAIIQNRGKFCGAEPMAVKVVHLDRQLELLTDHTDLTKLRRRLRNLLAFNHDHLVKYHKITITQGPQGGTSIELMMDYYNGEDLKTLIRNLRQRRDLLSEAAAVAYTIEIAEGLGFLHDRQIIHGDLKPANILTTHYDNGSRKLAICDLDDIVHMERDATCSRDITQLRGTKRYMSPEMLRKFAIEGSENPGRKTDMWSLGCIMLELADCVVGNDRKWLSKGLEKVEVGDKVNDQKFIQLIIDGYVPFPAQTIPSYIAASLQQCVCASAERISARVLIQQLKHETPLGASFKITDDTANRNQFNEAAKDIRGSD